MGGIREDYTIPIGKHDEKRPVGRPSVEQWIIKKWIFNIYVVRL
jgi:hypothetical protein